MKLSELKRGHIIVFKNPEADDVRRMKDCGYQREKETNLQELECVQNLIAQLDGSGHTHGVIVTDVGPTGAATPKQVKVIDQDIGGLTHATLDDLCATYGGKKATVLEAKPTTKVAEPLEKLALRAEEAEKKGQDYGFGHVIFAAIKARLNNAAARLPEQLRDELLPVIEAVITDAAQAGTERMCIPAIATFYFDAVGEILEPSPSDHVELTSNLVSDCRESIARAMKNWLGFDESKALEITNIILGSDAHFLLGFGALMPLIANGLNPTTVGSAVIKALDAGTTSSPVLWTAGDLLRSEGQLENLGMLENWCPCPRPD